MYIRDTICFQVSCLMAAESQRANGCWRPFVLSVVFHRWCGSDAFPLSKPKWRSAASLNLYREHVKRRRRGEEERRRRRRRRVYTRKLQTGCGILGFKRCCSSSFLLLVWPFVLDFFFFLRPFSPRLRNDGKKPDRLHFGSGRESGCSEGCR